MARSSKLIVTNGRALQTKYGDRKREVIEAVDRLRASDAIRGIDTTLIEIDDPSAMSQLSAPSVKLKRSVAQVKRAIDTLCTRMEPDYVMLLGGVDVIPHASLNNPLGTDGDDPDAHIPSDLPYACEDGNSKEPAKFLGPTRVVGRLPDPCGARDPTELIGLLARAAGHVPRAAAEFSPAFGVSAAVWRGSSELSMAAIDGGGTTAARLVSPEGTGWDADLLGRRIHFYNCHGATADGRYYGESKKKFPIALTSAELSSAVREGTVVAAECCYGAELYDRKLTSGVAPICEAYLHAGASGFFGSTNVAYGLPDGSAAADIIVQHFLRGVLAGASLGRAALEARHSFIAGRIALDPIDLKTLAQFLLLGDPSLQPVVALTSPVSPVTGLTAPVFDSLPPDTPLTHALAGSLRRLRRTLGARAGRANALSVPVARPTEGVRLSPRIRAVMAQATGRAAIPDARVSSFLAEVDGSSLRFHIATGRPTTRSGAHAPPGLTSIVAVRVTELDGQVIAVQTLLSK